jgi:hypothetical protein
MGYSSPLTAPVKMVTLLNSASIGTRDDANDVRKEGLALFGDTLPNTPIYQSK